MSSPALLLTDTDDLFVAAEILSDRCLGIARVMERNGAIDLKIQAYAEKLANFTQAACDALPTGVGDMLTPKVARLHNALDMYREPGQVAA
jgi:hypothetical protein